MIFIWELVLRLISISSCPYCFSSINYFNSMCIKAMPSNETNRNNISTSRYGGSFLNWNQTVLAYTKPTSRWFNLKHGQIVRGSQQSFLLTKISLKTEFEALKKVALLFVANVLQTVTSCSSRRTMLNMRDNISYNGRKTDISYKTILYLWLYQAKVPITDQNNQYLIITHNRKVFWKICWENGHNDGSWKFISLQDWIK